MTDWTRKDVALFSEIRRALKEAKSADLHEGQIVIDIKDVEFLVKALRKWKRAAQIRGETE